MTTPVHIGKAAELAGISVDTIRFYQKLGLIRIPDRSASGYRLFDAVQISDLKFVRHAQELGFALSEIKELLALRQKHHACSEVQAMLRSKLGNVRSRIRSLMDLENELKAALRDCNKEMHLRAVSHEKDCCPLLKKLDRNNEHGSRYAGARQAARK